MGVLHVSALPVPGRAGGQLTWLRHTPATAGAVIGYPGSVYAALIGR